MTLSAFRVLNDIILGQKSTFIANTITAAPTTFGLTAPEATAMSDAADLYATALLDLQAAEAAFEAAKVARDSQRVALLDTFCGYLNQMYATQTVTDESIASLTLAVRDQTRTPIVPTIPTDVLATPFADGTVKLTWNRNGSAYGVVFTIEMAPADATSWTVIGNTTKAKATFSGFNPGTPCWFRVIASKNGIVSDPSFYAGIYIPSPIAQQEEAA